MTEAFDFKEQSRSLLKRLGQNPGAPLNQGLALAAVEAALREAYALGQKAAHPVSKGSSIASSNASANASARRPSPSNAAQPARGAPQKAEAPRECGHEWEEAFVDGVTVEAKCMECGMLQSEAQSRCNHYFVRVGAGEICMACRKPRRIGK